MRIIKIEQTKFKKANPIAKIFELFDAQMKRHGLYKSKDASEEKITGQQTVSSKETWKMTKLVANIFGGNWGQDVYTFPPLKVETSDIGWVFFDELEEKLIFTLAKCDVTAEDILKAQKGESINNFVLLYELIRRTAAYVLRENLEDPEESFKGVEALGDFLQDINSSGHADKKDFISGLFGIGFSHLGAFIGNDFPFEKAKLNNAIIHTHNLASNKNTFMHLNDAVDHIQKNFQAFTFAYLAPKGMEGDITRENLSVNKFTLLYLRNALDYYEKKSRSWCRDSKTVVKQDRQLKVLSSDYQIEMLIDPIAYELLGEKVTKKNKNRLTDITTIVKKFLIIHLDISEFQEMICLLQKIILYSGWLGVAAGLLNEESIIQDIDDFSSQIEKNINEIHIFFKNTYRNPKIVSAGTFQNLLNAISNLKNKGKLIRSVFDSNTIKFVSEDFVRSLNDLEKLGQRRRKAYLNLSRIKEHKHSIPSLMQLKLSELEPHGAIIPANAEQKLTPTSMMRDELKDACHRLKEKLQLFSGVRGGNLVEKRKETSKALALFIADLLKIKRDTDQQRIDVAEELTKDKDGQGALAYKLIYSGENGKPNNPNLVNYKLIEQFRLAMVDSRKSLGSKDSLDRIRNHTMSCSDQAKEDAEQIPIEMVLALIVVEGLFHLARKDEPSLFEKWSPKRLNNLFSALCEEPLRKRLSWIGDDFTQALEIARENFEVDDMLAHTTILARRPRLTSSENEKESVMWLRCAADQGLAKAQSDLGVSFFRGWGVTKDEKEAAEWLRRAAEQGDIDAQHNLGVCLNEGHGVTKDEKQAVEWFQKAAEQGFAKAQNELGLCLLYGCGTMKDEKQAIDWFQKAAELGLEEAQNNLEICIWYSKGIDKDDKQSRLAPSCGCKLM